MSPSNKTKRHRKNDHHVQPLKVRVLNPPEKKKRDRQAPTLPPISRNICSEEIPSRNLRWIITCPNAAKPRQLQPHGQAWSRFHHSHIFPRYFMWCIGVFYLPIVQEHPEKFHPSLSVWGRMVLFKHTKTWITEDITVLIEVITPLLHL